MENTTEEERKQARRLYMKQWREANKEKIAEYNKQYYKNNAEMFAEYHKQYHKNNAEMIAEYNKQWREKNADYDKQYRQTPMGRAKNLVNSYKQNDKKYDRGECTLTTKWIIDNIFSQKCIYCGESDWKKLGCDRKDNSKPHTEDNVVCSCWDCNIKRQKKTFEEFLAESSQIK